MVCILLGLGICWTFPAVAEESENPVILTLVTGRGVDHNLKELPGNILTADINWDASYYNGVSLEKDFGRFASRFKTLADNPLGKLGQGVELVASKHRGLQDNFELGLAYKLKSPSWRLAGLRTELDLGIGLSHALSEPNYEDGPFDEPDERYQTQLLLLLDSRWRLATHPHFSLLLRVHHRSGAYGVIAPRNVGSNFLSVGVGYDF